LATLRALLIVSLEDSRTRDAEAEVLSGLTPVATITTDCGSDIDWNCCASLG